MAKLSYNDISSMQFGKEKLIMMDDYAQVNSAREMLRRYKLKHLGKFDFSTKADVIDGKFLFRLTVYDHALER